MTTAIAETTPPVRSVEAPYTLAEPPPRALGFLDQFGLWANLGVTILAPVGAVFVLQSFTRPSLIAAFTSVLVGTVLGAALLGLATIPGVHTGAPAMVILRGLFGARLSYLPTVLNVVQLLGWSVFEIVVISTAAAQLLPWHHTRVGYVLIAGALTTLMALRPLGAVRVLRRYAIVGVAFATAYLFVQLLRHPLPSLTAGSWSGFWGGADYTIAVAVSWVPLAADYTRHARRARTAFAGAFLGYTVTQVAYYTLGLVALATIVHAGAHLQHDMFGAFIAVPVGWLAFGILVLRELDESFADTYSTVVSIQNLRPLADRRVLAVLLGVVATVLALVLHIADYQSFLLLIGSVFVPLSAVLVVDYFVLGHGRNWDTSEGARPRWSRLLPWVIGFAAYQLVYPGGVSWWVTGWTHLQRWLHFTPASVYSSASLVSFAAAGLLTLLVGWRGRARA